MIKNYISYKKKSFFLFVSFVFIYTSVYYLYNVPFSAIIYGLQLCTFLGCIVICVDFYFFYLRHEKLRKLEAMVAVSLDELPSTNSLIEEDYKRLLQKLFDEKVKIASKTDIQKSEMIDYYTLWAHQIKTPIAGMQLLIQEGIQNQGNNQTFLELNAELFKIEQYVEMVLTYLRIESMSGDMLLQSYSLESILRQALRKYAKIFIGKKITLDFQEMKDKVVTDEKWFLFMVEQILSNTLKYTKSGCISIYMEKGAVVIKDTGIGIQAEDLPRVFEKGFTGFNGRMDKKSTGIGLYLCKKISKKLNHTITIESELGVGTKVMIFLTNL